MLGYRGGEYHSFSSEAAARQYLQRRGVDVDAALAAQAEAQQRVAQEEAQEQQRQALAEAEAQQQLGAAAADTQQQQLAAAAPVGPAAAGSDGTSSGSPPPEGNSASSGSDASGSSGDGIDGSAGGQPASGGPLLSDPQAAKQMRQHFNSPDLQGRGRKSGMAGAKQRSRRARAAGRPPKPPKGPSPSLDKAQTAWEQAAMAWRQKNMPSKAEIKKIVKEQAAAALPRYRPPSRTPMDHVQSERGGPATARPQGGKAGGEAGGGGKGMSRKQRAHYRHMCQARVQGIASFAQASLSCCFVVWVEVCLCDVGAGAVAGQLASTSHQHQPSAAPLAGHPHSYMPLNRHHHPQPTHQPTPTVTGAAHLRGAL